MGRRIRIRIFIPVLILVILFPVLTWMIFSKASDWYIGHMVKKEVSGIMRQVEIESESLYGEGMDEKDYAKELLVRMKSAVKQQHLGADLLVMNSKKKLIYPNGDLEAGIRRDMYEICRAMLEDGELDSGQMVTVQAGGQQYLISLFEVESSQKIRAKYYLGYAPIPDTGLLMSYCGGLLLAITAGLLAVSAVMVWITAGKIAKPLGALCRQAHGIGNGAFRPIEENYQIWEIEQLKDSFNEMGRRLEESREENARFFQNVSHDLRTPLVSISGYAQGIQCGVMKDPEKAADIILSESLRMTELVESILTLSKLDNHNIVVSRIAIQLDEFLEEQVEVAQGAAGKKKLILQITEEPVVVETDPSLLIRLFQNVISNCIRYANSWVWVKLETEGEMAVILVEDDGDGFSADDLPHVFDRFYKGKEGDFGIGLSVVRSMTEYIGGTVKAGNRELPLHGAVYEIRLPFRAVTN